LEVQNVAKLSITDLDLTGKLLEVNHLEGVVEG